MAPDRNPSEVAVIFPEDFEVYIAGHREGTYQLIDVRQPEEYEQFHLPGSGLIPLPPLSDSTEGLDRARDLIIYCAVGGRSRMAAHFLARRGFTRVFHLQGGIEAWELRTAVSPPELHLQFVRGDESAIEAATIACRFETGIEQFYRAVIVCQSSTFNQDTGFRLKSPAGMTKCIDYIENVPACSNQAWPIFPMVSMASGPPLLYSAIILYTLDSERPVCLAISASGLGSTSRL